MDTSLNILLIICGSFLIVIPLFFNLREKIDIKDKKGKLLRVDFSRLNVKGKILIGVSIFSLGAGIYKAVRDNNSKSRADNDQIELKDSIVSLNSKVEHSNHALYALYRKDSTLNSEQVKSDNAILKKIQKSLREKGFAINPKDTTIDSYNIKNNISGVEIRNVTNGTISNIQSYIFNTIDTKNTKKH